MSEGSLFFLDVDEIVDVEKFRTIKRKKIQQGISPVLVAKERNSIKEGYIHIGRSKRDVPSRSSGRETRRQDLRAKEAGSGWRKREIYKEKK